MKDWDYYKLILALHRAKTVRGAANVLGVNHATVSRRLTQINSSFNVPVFERATDGYRPTDLGLELIAAAEDMESITIAAERKSRAATATLSGPIRLSMGEPIAQYLLQDALAQFAHDHPQIELTIETSLRLVDLDRSEADIVIRGTQTPPEHLVGRRLFPFYLSDYCAANYLTDTRPEDRRWLRFSKSMQGEDWLSKSLFPDAPISIRTDDLIWLVKATISGHGMMRTACYIGDSEADLIRLPGTSTIKAQDLWVLTHPDLKHTPRIKHLMKYLAAAIEEKRGLIQGWL